MTNNYDPETAMQAGRYLEYGGQYLPEVLMPEINRVAAAYAKYKDDPDFLNEFHTLLREYAGRPSLLYYAKNMTADLGGAQIYLKREDLNHTGAHKINNVIGQALLAKRMGKTRLIAETGAGQHGVATATIAALFGMECEIFMGKMDTDRQRLNVYRMELLGAKVNAVTSGSMVLKDAVNAALQNYAARSDDTFYVMGSAVGPHPFPAMVHDFQSVISKESKAQLQDAIGQLPDYVVACVGGGSNAIGSFAEYIKDPSVHLIGCEAAGKGITTKQTAATMALGSTGIFHGMKSRFLQNHDGQIDSVYSISAGLDYPGVGPEHVALMDEGRAQYVPITDDEAVDAFEYIAKQEGIIAAIESCHAVAEVQKLAPTLSKDQVIICTLSGRGDKDVASIAKYRGIELNED
ncbi:tryptophan synthase subunit beta [Lacticaseibacillus suibinensis]|uniref:tryptophan synthase subunit beta n=1 Tax=Lacticaseibacillus suibinensis TaxID=2486011 RepID=UPI000F79410E|nr:tryptophan synthase subunit beta [Lacticaseibacillus suibinensis]